MSTLKITRLAMIAGLVLVGINAMAKGISQDVVITKANDNRTLTVRYSGANAALVELRVNGSSVASRNVSESQSSGETNFSLDQVKLSEGTNNVEIRLYDAAGKLIAVQKTEVTVNKSQGSPVFLTKPSQGTTVQGFVDIQVGFKTEIKNSYVSFFVDDEFKALKNFSPYSFLWDTSKISNGWHEVEAWVVDDTSTTFRTQRIRVFVNNPSGNTARESIKTEPRESIKAPVTVPKVAVSHANPSTATKPVAAKPVMETSDNQVNVKFSSPAQMKAIVADSGLTTGLRILKPTGNRTLGHKGVTPKANIEAKVPKTPEIPQGAIVEVKPSKPSNSNLNGVVAKTNKPISVTTGSRLPKIGYYPIFVNGTEVKFDVRPRVDEDGIALTPFRHLFEHVGGEVKWASVEKTVFAKGLGSDLNFKIGADFATVNGSRVGFERKSFLENGRSVVPLSFVQRLLNVEISYDPATKHVLVTKNKS